MLAILIFSFLAIPQYKRLSEAKKENKIIAKKFREKRDKLELLKTLPSFDVSLGAKDDTILAIKKLFDQQKFQIVDFTEGSDKIGKYISFTASINSYTSLARVIYFLNGVSQILPVKYTGYEIMGRNIKVNALCYIAH